MALNPGDLAAKIEAIRAKQAACFQIGHQQADFFVADLVDYAMKDDQATMEASGVVQNRILFIDVRL